MYTQNLERILDTGKAVILIVTGTRSPAIIQILITWFHFSSLGNIQYFYFSMYI